MPGMPFVEEVRVARMAQARRKRSVTYLSPQDREHLKLLMDLERPCKGWFPDPRQQLRRSRQAIRQSRQRIRRIPEYLLAPMDARTMQLRLLLDGQALGV